MAGLVLAIQMRGTLPERLASLDPRHKAGDDD
jgi:hypothetical protein